MNDSSAPFCHGLPGSISAVSMFDCRSYLSTAFETNFGPLSERKYFGAPCSLTNLVSTSMSRPERMLPATSIASDSRVYSSMTVRHLNSWPFAQESNTKSYAHTWFASSTGTGRGLEPATRRLGRFLGTCSPARCQRRCARSGLISCPRRPRKTWMRRYPNRGYWLDSSRITLITGPSFTGILDLYPIVDLAAPISAHAPRIEISR